MYFINKSNQKPYKKNNLKDFILQVIFPIRESVGMAGFEPAASTSQMWRDTGLRYIPFGIAKVGFLSAMQNKKSKNLRKVKLPRLNFSL